MVHIHTHGVHSIVCKMVHFVIFVTVDVHMKHNQTHVCNKEEEDSLRALTTNNKHGRSTR